MVFYGHRLEGCKSHGAYQQEAQIYAILDAQAAAYHRVKRTSQNAGPRFPSKSIY